MGQDAQSDPTLHAVLAVVAAARQPEASLEQADAALHAGSEAVGPAKRRSVLEAAALRAERSLAWQRDDAHTSGLGTPFIGERKEGSISGEDGRWLAELSTMVGHARRQLLGIWWVARQQDVAADQSTIHFIQQQLAPELRRMAHLAATDDRGMWLEQTGHLVGRGHHLVLEDASLGLRTHLLDQGHNLLQCMVDTRRCPIRAAGEALTDQLGLVQARPRHAEQLSVQIRAYLFPLPHGGSGRDALRQALGAARAIAKQALGPGAQRVPRPADQSTDHPHTIGQQ